MQKKRIVPGTPRRIAKALFLIGMAGTPSSHAFEFANADGSVSGSFDTTVSLGGQWRTSARDPALVAISNGGTSRTPNDDDGNLNYERGAAVSALAKVTHELDLKYGNYGFFGRLFYFYDQAVEHKGQLSSVAKDRVGNRVDLLDAYVRGQFEPGGRKLSLRLGNQVVSWGESTFLPNGINVINPVDLSRLRGPGAELKEAFVPSQMLWAAQEVNETLSLEGYYQLNFRKTRLDPRGTFFSTTDALSDGGDKIFGGFGRRKDDHFPIVPPIGANAATAQIWVPRQADRDAKESGQYGIAARFFLREWNNTEVGVYHLNYHSRTPFLTTIRGTVSTALGPGTARYLADYPENIRLYGIGVSTSAPAGIALQAEYSYRPNQPLQLSGVEMVLAALGLPNTVTGTAPGTAAAVPTGTLIQGFSRVKMHQLQITGTKSFGPQLGSDQFVVVGEVGYTRLDLPSGVRFAGPGVNLPAPESSGLASNGSVQPNGEGYATSNSWGYRLLARLEYQNAIAGVNLAPRLAFAHDVQGVSPTFNQGTKAVTLGLGMSWRQNWAADLSWTSFFGGRTYSGTDPVPTPGQSSFFASSANPLKDRDFVAASVSYSF